MKAGNHVQRQETVAIAHVKMDIVNQLMVKKLALQILIVIAEFVIMAIVKAVVDLDGMDVLQMCNVAPATLVKYNLVLQLALVCQTLQEQLVLLMPIAQVVIAKAEFALIALLQVDLALKVHNAAL